MPFIVATYVYASSQGQRTHSARTNLFVRDSVVAGSILARHGGAEQLGMSMGVGGN